MIDTTFMDYIAEPLQPIDCYDRILNKSKDIHNIYNTQKEQIIDILKGNLTCSNIIFIGHHPIIGLKSKETKTKIQKSHGLIQLFTDIKTCLNGKKIYYLCADIHMYQTGCVNIDNLIINQYIVGTGGAHLDRYDGLEISVECDKIKYQIRHKINDKYGYLVVEINDTSDDVSFSFVDIEPIHQNGGNKIVIKYRV